jgi:hypothetical protein
LGDFGRFGRFWAILGDLGRFWAILGDFFTISPGHPGTAKDVDWLRKTKTET